MTLVAETPPETIKDRVLNEPEETLQRMDVSESQDVCSDRVKESCARKEMDESPIPFPNTVIIPDPVAALLLNNPLMSRSDIENSCEEDAPRDSADTTTRRLDKGPKNILHTTAVSDDQADDSQVVADVDSAGVGFPRPPK